MANLRIRERTCAFKRAKRNCLLAPQFCRCGFFDIHVKRMVNLLSFVQRRFVAVCLAVGVKELSVSVKWHILCFTSLLVEGIGVRFRF